MSVLALAELIIGLPHIVSCPNNGIVESVIVECCRCIVFVLCTTLAVDFLTCSCVSVPLPHNPPGHLVSLHLYFLWGALGLPWPLGLWFSVYCMLCPGTWSRALSHKVHFITLEQSPWYGVFRNSVYQTRSLQWVHGF